MSTEEVQSTPDAGVDSVTESMGRLNAGEDTPQRTEEDYNSAQLTLRAIVSSKEAGVIIGKAGQNVADLRDKTGVRAGVSKVVPGVHDRVLTVTGPLDGISNAYGLVADGLLKGAPAVGMGGVVSNPNTHRTFQFCLFADGDTYRCCHWGRRGATIFRRVFANFHPQQSVF
jgi:heterogeneous nuclear rnp K-like protein 2